MKFSITALAALLPALAQAIVIPSGQDDASAAAPSSCCCCNISALGGPAIVCNPAIPADQCICTDVLCPPNAPTTTLKPTPKPTATPTLPPAAPPLPKPTDDLDVLERLAERAGQKKGKKEPCCCCNAGKQEIDCVMRAAGDCVCADVVCPAGAPTVWPNRPQKTSKPAGSGGSSQ